MKVRYKPVCLAGHRTQENQALLLASAGHAVWEQWCAKNDNGENIGIIGQDSILDDKMRHLRRALVEMDVYYSGFNQERDA